LVSYVSLNHSEAYVGQPVQMTVSVYTNTWFTSGVDVGNIQVEGALTVYFRSVPGQKTFGGKAYSGVDFIYNVFPTQAGTISIPELEIHVESPKVGDYKGIKHTIHTKSKSIAVNGVPVGYSPDNWLVSSTLNVSQKWSASTKTVKVGDVLQRSVSRSASGTLGEFIPAITWDTIPGVSIYQKRPSINTNKTKTYVSASRTEAANYLFEKEGDVTLPRMEFVYWNYGNHKFYKKVIDSITIHVEPNPDLSMLASAKKRLEQETVAEAEEDKPFLILGLTIKAFITYLVLGVILLYILYKFLPWLYKRWKAKYKSYHASESYAFKQLKHAIGSSDTYKVLNLLKIWLIKLNPDIPNMKAFIDVYGSDELRKSYLSLEQRATEGSTSFNSSVFKSELEKARSVYINSQKAVTAQHKGIAHTAGWLNPTSSEKSF